MIFKHIKPLIMLDGPISEFDLAATGAPRLFAATDPAAAIAALAGKCLTFGSAGGAPRLFAATDPAAAIAALAGKCLTFGSASGRRP